MIEDNNTIKRELGIDQEKVGEAEKGMFKDNNTIEPGERHRA
jgi:hypothetical protein